MTATSGSVRIDSDRTRRRILQSARGLSRDLGYEQVRMADIAARVGCSRATVYNHFPNRDLLLEALCREYLTGFSEIYQVVRDKVADHATIFEVLRDTIFSELQWRVANADLRGALDTARTQRKAFYVSGNQQIDEQMLAWYGGIYRASSERGHLRAGLNLHFATQAMYAMIDYVVSGFAVDMAPPEVLAASDQVARLQWHALYRMEPQRSPKFRVLQACGCMPPPRGSA